MQSSLTNLCPEASFYKTYKVDEKVNLNANDLSTENVTRVYIANIINVGSIDIKNDPNQEFHIKYKSKAPVYSHIVNLIFKGIQVPEHWTQEGVNPPNMEAKTIAQNICFSLYNDYGLIPIKIASTKEEGVFIYYKHFDNNRALLAEVYNNLEVAVVVNDEINNKILYSEDIKGSNFMYVIEKLIEH